MEIGAFEAEPIWTELPRKMIRRGLHGVRLVVLMPRRASRRWCPSCCMRPTLQVPFYRNMFSHIPATKVRETSHMLKAIPAREAGKQHEKIAMIIADLCRQKLGKAADLSEAHIEEPLTFYASPTATGRDQHQRSPGADHEEVRRRTRVMFLDTTLRGEFALAENVGFPPCLAFDHLLTNGCFGGCLLRVQLTGLGRTR